MKDRSNLSWTRGAKPFALHVGKSRKPLLHVLPDNRWPNMRRIRYRGTSASDLLNPTRAKDTAGSRALADLGAQAAGKRAGQVAPARFSASCSSHAGHPTECPGGAAQQHQFATETVVTADEPFDDADGWGSRVKRPPRPGWRVADYSDERRTRWERRRLLPARGRA